MIKINLLPYRIARRKENIRRQVSVFFGLVVLALTCMLYAWISLSREIAALEKDVKAAKAELLTYQVTIRKAKEHQKTIERVKNKMEVIKKLEAERSGPVRILDAMTQCVVAKRMWLKSMAEEKGSLTIKGIAVDNATIARFMNNLEKSVYFTAVDLESSKQTLIDNKLKFKEFLINCTPINSDVSNRGTQSAAKGVK
jgi:type IV pilus assembly protein PilN